MKKLVIIVSLIMVGGVTAYSQEAIKKEKTVKEHSIEQAEKLQKDLSLTDEQTEEVRKALSKKLAAMSNNKKIQDLAHKNIVVANLDYKNELQNILTPAQLKKRKELNAKDKK